MSDSELEEVSTHVRALMGTDDKNDSVVVLENSPVGESKSNGAVENAIKRIQGQVGTPRLALEDPAGRNIDLDPNIWQWLGECAADTFNRYKIGDDGVSPYKRVKGRESTVLAAAFGESARPCREEGAQHPT